MAAMTPGIDDDASFDAFYRRRWRDAARWATALCGDRALGEELAQEAFVRVEPRFAALDNADGYLRTTVVNLTKASHRSTARRRWRERTTAQRDVTPAGDADPGPRQRQGGADPGQSHNRDLDPRRNNPKAGSMAVHMRCVLTPKAAPSEMVRLMYM